MFEEQGVVKTPFYGGYGLMAERGIPKAAFHAFELLHELGDRRLSANSENSLLTERADGQVVVALWNYAEPGEAVGAKTFRLNVQGNGFQGYRMRVVDGEHGSGLRAWQEAGSPVSPTRAKIVQIQAGAALPAAQRHSLTDPITIEPQGLAVLELGR